MIFEINNETNFELDSNMETRLQEALNTVMALESVACEGEVSLLFVDNETIQNLNKTYREKDAVTDVLSFPQYESVYKNGLKEPYAYLGDVVISIDRAEEQALEFGHSLEREIIYLVVHSLLHLLGYDHMTDTEKKQMRAHEKEILKKLKIFK